MTGGEPDNLTPRHLRAIGDKLDKLTEDVGELKRRATLIDERVALVHADLAGIFGRMDRIESRLARVETRLDPRDADTPAG
jgi:hypothetical protein